MHGIALRENTSRKTARRETALDQAVGVVGPLECHVRHRCVAFLVDDDERHEQNQHQQSQNAGDGAHGGHGGRASSCGNTDMRAKVSTCPSLMNFSTEKGKEVMHATHEKSLNYALPW